MACFQRELTDAVTCCTQYSSVSEPGTRIVPHSETKQATSRPSRVCGSEADAVFEKMLDPIAGSPATRKSVAGIINLIVDDLFGSGETEIEQRVLARLGKVFHVGSEDWNDVTFTGQRFRWTKDPQSGLYIDVSQEEAIEELEEIPV